MPIPDSRKNTSTSNVCWYSDHSFDEGSKNSVRRFTPQLKVLNHNWRTACFFSAYESGLGLQGWEGFRWWFRDRLIHDSWAHHGTRSQDNILYYTFARITVRELRVLSHCREKSDPVPTKLSHLQVLVRFQQTGNSESYSNEKLDAVICHPQVCRDRTSPR